MKIENIKNKNLRKSNDAVVGIVVALLLVGLFLSVLMIVQTTFIPNWMEQLEAEHMDEVGNQFAQLKYAVDIQSLVGEYKGPNIPKMFTSITLGSKEYPILRSSRAFGSLEIIPDFYAINITNDTAGYFANYSIGGIKYISKNSYFINQHFAFEAGAIILEQYEGNVMAIEPSIDIEHSVNNNIIAFNMTNLSTNIGGKPSVSGYGTYPVRTEFFGIESNLITNISAINIYTDHPYVWKSYINKTFNRSGFDPVDIYDTTINGKNLEIDFSTSNGEGLFFDIILNISNIKVQLGPGWVETNN